MLTMLLGLALVGCGGEDDEVADAARIDAAPSQGDGGTIVDSGSSDANCFMNPTTHLQIINACTSAQKIDHRPVLPLLNPNGTLPPLP